MKFHTVPDLLVLHLKRFKFTASGLFGRKIDYHVRFPEQLDLARFSSPPGALARYTLVGVLVHVGSSLQGGHYFAHVRGSDGWVTKDDRRVRGCGCSVCSVCVCGGGWMRGHVCPLEPAEVA